MLCVCVCVCVCVAYAEPLAAVDCGSRIQGLSANAQATCTGNTKFTGNNCTATCNAGYDGGSSVFTCGTNGLWQGALTCTRECCRKRERGRERETTLTHTHTGKDCGVTFKSLPSNAVAPSCASTLYGDQCNVTCKEGYVGGPTPFACNAEGEWTGNLVCQGKECGRNIPNLADFAVARCRGDTSFGGTPCLALCKEGFQGNNATYRYPHSTFLRPFPLYSPSVFGIHVRNLTLASLQVPSLDLLRAFPLYSPSVFCTHVCAANPTPNAACHGRCTQTAASVAGTWATSDKLACAAKRCPALIDLPASLNRSTACPNMIFGQVCNASCLPGYTGPSVNFTCGPDSLWLGNRTASCTRECITHTDALFLTLSPSHTFSPSHTHTHAAKDCGSKLLSLDKLASGSVCTGNTRFGGDPCRAECPRGFVPLAGTDIILCGTDGQWETSKFTCVGKPCLSFPLSLVCVSVCWHA